MKKIKVVVFILLVYFTSSVIAQQPDQKQGKREFKMPNLGRVYGRIIDSKTKEIVPFASVAIFKNDSVVAGNFAGNNGEFNLENLPFGKLTLKITFLGFKPLQQTIIITPQNEEQDLGDIKIEMEETLLKSVEVVAEKSAVEMSIDRKIFNVDKNIISKGGTATDVMKNIPSVTIDADGNAQLRQNGTTIYVDGRPTVLTLDQIPADQIDRVEIITNPSAKFEASASGGIINIVMKSNTKPGYNGIVTGGIGTNNRYNGMVALNIKQKPIGFSVTYNYNTFKNPVKGYTDRTNLLNNVPEGYYDLTDRNTLQNTFQAGTATLDYYINNHNTLSLSENIVVGDFNSQDVQLFNTSDASATILNNGNRTTNALTHFENYTTKLHHKKTFQKKGKELTADMNYSTSNAHSPSYFTTNTDAANTNTPLPDNPQLQNNFGHNVNQMFTAQADYVNPINDSTKLELGVRSNYKPSTQFLDVSQYNYISNNYVPNSYLTNHYNIEDLVNAAYINYSMRYKKINYMLGLRFEDSYYKGTLTNKNDSSFHYSYPSNINNLKNALFPSIFISKKFNTKQEIQFNISRKINRPNFRQLMPFIMASNPKNYTIGNPNLTPEFITMAELNFNQLLTKGNLFFTLFFRNTENPLTNYIYPLPADSSILVQTTINGKQSNTFGMDNTFKYTLFKGFEATWNMNLFYTFINAKYNNVNFSNQGFNYTTKLNLVYRLPKNYSLQLSGSYQSPKIIPQGTNKEIYFADCGLSKEIHKFITLTASVSDIFNTKGSGTNYVTDQYLQSQWGRRESRYVKFTAMIRFGKVDASLFKKRPPSQQPSDSDNGYY
jgi:outer membrane receptor protein involved in Fe transport